MRLLFLIDSLGSGGAQRQMVTIAPLLKRQGFDVEFLCYHRDSFFIEPLRIANIKVDWIIVTNPLIRILKIRSFIRKGNYHAVISFLETPDFFNCIAAIGGHTWKVITSERSAKEQTFHTCRGKFIGSMKRYSDAIVCNSENARKMWIKHYPQYENKLKVIYNIVTLPPITSTYTPRRGGKTHIVVAASYQYLKNPINVVKAVNLLGDKGKNRLMLDWYGATRVSQSATQAYDEALNLINKYNLREVIHLNEAISTICEKMNESDVVGLFSQLEGLPNTICEGMSLSKPIVMSKVSDYKVLVDASNGVLCDWDNIYTIKEALNTLLCLSNEQLMAMGEESKKKAELLFGKDTIINQWVNLIRC